MISIVAAYHNRKDLFINTLKSLTKSSIKDFEFIVVDDCSDESERIEDLQTDYSFLRVIRIEKQDRWYVNPCVPFNIGFKEAKGDIVIIQNPECLHLTDILAHVSANLQDNDYFAYSCYSLDQEMTKNFSINKEIALVSRSVGNCGESGWYNHSVYRPVGFHFCSAIKKQKLDELEGFDERYATGIAYDDNEFLARVIRKQLNYKIIDDGIVLHQWHYDPNKPKLPNLGELIEKNRNLYFNHTLQETTTNWKDN